MAERHIITALFDSRAAAERAVEHLVQRNGLDRSAVRVHAGGAENVTAGTHAARSEDHHDFVGRADARPGGSAEEAAAMGLPPEMPPADRAAFTNRLHRGGILVLATLPEDEVDAAIQTLEENGAVELDERDGADEAGRRPAPTGGGSDGGIADTTARFALAGAERDAGGPRAGETGTGWQDTATGRALGLGPDGSRHGGAAGPVVGGQTSGGAARTIGTGIDPDPIASSEAWPSGLMSGDAGAWLRRPGGSTRVRRYVGPESAVREGAAPERQGSR
jgi:hypothetical protein